MLVVVEGCRGVGKGTFIERLVYELEDRGYSCNPTTQPTESIYGQMAIANLRKGKNDIETTMQFCLDRKHHVELMSKSCAPRTIIVCDRYSLSTMVYQPDDHCGLIEEIHKHLIVPDITILIDADHDSWIAGNMDNFVNKRLGKRTTGDRANKRRVDKDPNVYNGYRRKYIAALDTGLVRDHVILSGFRDTGVMVNDVLSSIERKHSDKFGTKWR